MSYKFDPRNIGIPGSFSTSRELVRRGVVESGELSPRENPKPALPLVAYVTRQQRRLEARKRAKEAANRPGKGGVA